MNWQHINYADMREFANDRRVLVFVPGEEFYTDVDGTRQPNYEVGQFVARWVNRVGWPAAWRTIGPEYSDADMELASFTWENLPGPTVKNPRPIKHWPTHWRPLPDPPKKETQP